MKKTLLRLSIIFFWSFSFLLNPIFAKAGSAQQNFSSIAYVIFNEILANEPGSNTKLEWVELFNADSVERNLGGWLFASKDYITELPTGAIIPAGGFLVIGEMEVERGATLSWKTSLLLKPRCL